MLGIGIFYLVPANKQVHRSACWVRRGVEYNAAPVAGRKRDASAIIEMARREGQEIPLPAVL